VANEYVLASGNKGKLREIEGVLKPLGFVIHAQSQWQTPEAEETASTFIENAFLKARQASVHVGLPAIADDSGLVVPALGGAPGIYSARYAGEGASDQDNIQKLLKELLRLPSADRRAYFYCAIVLLESPDDPAPLVATARWHGEILPVQQGESGFGYDPVFKVAGMNCTAAELKPEVKQSISHRGLALKLLLGQLRERDGLES
jgi:XTP/dITP diphosphohydrolase